MPYVGRDLQRGNYLKLDDISSSFNGSTTTFNLTSGGNAFFPGSAFSIIVSLGGVIQEPESAFQIDRSQIIFAQAPSPNDDFFCIVQGVALGVGVPGHNTVNNDQLAKPLSYGDYFRWDSANNRVGINTLLPSTALDVVGDATFSGNVAIGGTLTYEDVANIDAVGIITARAGIEDKTLTTGHVVFAGTGGRLIGESQLFYDNSNNFLGIGTNTFGRALTIRHAEPRIRLVDDDTGSFSEIYTDNTGHLYLNADAGGNNGGSRILFNVDGGEKVRIRNDGYVGINTTSPSKLVTIKADKPFVRLEAEDGSDKRLDFEVTNTGIATISATQSSQQLSFKTTSGEAIRIKSDLKVGINVSDPDSIFETVSPATDGINAHIGGLYNNGGQTAVRRIEFGVKNYRNAIQSQQGSGGDNFTSDNDLILNPSGGKIGIGSDEPANKLDVALGAAWIYPDEDGTEAIALKLGKLSNFNSSFNDILVADNDGSSSPTYRVTNKINRYIANWYFDRTTSPGATRLNAFQLNSHDSGGGIGNAFIIRDFSNTADSVKLWSNGDSFVGVTTDGTTRNFGIGVANPLRRVDVVGNSLLVRPTIDNVSSSGNASAVNNSIIVRMPYGQNPASTNHGGARFGIQFTGANNTTDVSSLNFGNDPVKSASIYAISEDNLGYNRKMGLVFYTSEFDAVQEERLRIANDGKVGINSTTPTTPLEIYTAASAAWKFRINTSLSDGAGFYQRSNGDFELVLRDASNNNNYIAGVGGELQFVVNSSEKLRVVGTGISVTGKVLASGEIEAAQDYPDFRPTLDLNFAAVKKLDSRITYQRTGVASFVNKFGKVVLVGGDTPRFDHNPTTRECKGLLIEESRTNQWLYSEDLVTYVTGGALQQSTLADTTATTDPTGGTNAVLMAATATGGAHSFYKNFTSGSNGNVHTFSVWVKAAGVDYARIYVDTVGGNMGGPGVTFSTGNTWNVSASGVATQTATSVVEYPNGWWRLSVSGSFSNTTQYYCHVDLEGGEGDISFNGNGSNGMYVWGVQFESGTFPTSYIPTYGATATRGYEATTLEGTDFSDVFGTEFKEFSLVADYDNTQTNDGTSYAILDLWGEATGYDDRIEWFKDDASPYHIETRAFGQGNPIFANDELSASSKAKAQRFATSWYVPDYSNTSSRRFVVSMGGEAVDVIPDSSGTTVPQITRMGIGCNPTRLDFKPGLLHFKRLMVYNKTLSDGQLQNLSAQ